MTHSIAARPTGSIDPARILVVLLALAQIAAASLPALGIGTPIGDSSDRANTLITPAGWAFSIWGALYFGSVVFAIYQALPAQRENGLLAALRWPAAAAFLGNTLWATYVQLGGLGFASIAIILVGLAGSLVALRRVAAWPDRFAPGERWCAVLPLTALAAWLTAATIVNVAASLRFHGVDAPADVSPVVSAVVLLVGGVIAGTALARSKGCPPYALVFLWALAAIFAAGGQISGLVAIAVGVAALLTVAGCVVGLRGGGARHWSD